MDHSHFSSGAVDLSWRTPHCTGILCAGALGSPGNSRGWLLCVAVSQGPWLMPGPCYKLCGSPIGTESASRSLLDTASGRAGSRSLNTAFICRSRKDSVAPLPRSHDGTALASAGDSTGTAYLGLSNSAKVQNLYWNTELTPGSEIKRQSCIQTLPRLCIIHRCSFPVDDSLRSVTSSSELHRSASYRLSERRALPAKNGQLYGWTGSGTAERERRFRSDGEIPPLMGQ